MLLGGVVIMALLTPMYLWGSFSRVSIRGIAGLLLILGAVQLLRLGIHKLKKYRALRDIDQKNSQYDYLKVAFWVYVSGYFLIALGPVTNADSLDYHIGGALEMLNTGQFPFRPEWFHSRLVGAGEVLIALGLSVGAEQFGSLFQFVGLISVVSYFWFADRDVDQSWSKLLAISLLSTPVLLFLVSSPKPQMSLIAMTSLALVLSLRFCIPDHEGVARQNINKVGVFTLVVMLVMVAAIGKMNFLMSGGVVGFVALYQMYRSGLLKISLVIGLFLGGAILLPPAIWKASQFGGSWLNALLSPFPGEWSGTDHFEMMLRNYQDDPKGLFPLTLVIPSRIGLLSTVLGVGAVLVLYFNFKYKIINGYVAAALSVSAIGLLLGQSSARFFMEPYVWLLLSLLFFVKLEKNYIYEFFKTTVNLQAIAIISPLVIGIYTLLPGAFSQELREKVMIEKANGYAIMKWLDEELPQEARVISGHRSVAIMPRYSISNDWSKHDCNSGAGCNSPYIRIVREQRPNYRLVVTRGSSLNKKYSCNYYSGPYESYVATRNPFNSGKKLYAWIVVDGQHKKKCVDSDMG